jgi:methionine-rich copper-binding protein CopC
MIARSRTSRIILILTLAVWPLMAAAHINLNGSQPAANAVLKNMPDEVKLWFTGRVEPEFSRIEVTDTDGDRVDAGDVTADRNQRELKVRLNENLKPGPYQVNWSAVARDGHRVQGEFSFRIE